MLPGVPCGCQVYYLLSSDTGPHGLWAAVFRFQIGEQKQVLAAAKKSITDAAILAGDSDFLPAIEAAKPEGVVIHLFHGERPRQHSSTKLPHRGSQVAPSPITQRSPPPTRGSRVERRRRSTRRTCPVWPSGSCHRRPTRSDWPDRPTTRADIRR